MLVPLSNSPRDYAWGSRDAIARLQGRPPAASPEAELWFGDHPGAPAVVEDGSGRTLDEWIATVGPAHGIAGPLPYLLKILAAASPLSIQAHPTLAQARDGFAREERAGVPRQSAARNYRDDNHKPEVIVAVDGEFEALVGFRPAAEILRLLDVLAPETATPDPPHDAPPHDAPPRDAPLHDASPRDAPPHDAPLRDAPLHDASPHRLAAPAEHAAVARPPAASHAPQSLPVRPAVQDPAAQHAARSDTAQRAARDRLGHVSAVARLRDGLSSPDPAAALRAFVGPLLRDELRDAATALVAAVHASHAPALAEDLAAVRRIEAAHPGDPGVVVALLMNRVVLEEGQALFVPAGVPHAYLRGMGVEIMAASDNVLRGGLTLKHVDVVELLSVLDARPTAIERFSPRVHGEGVAVFAPPVPDFSLVRTRRTEESVDPTAVDVCGATIALATRGHAVLTGSTSTVELAPGTACLITPDESVVHVGGAGEVFFARSGESVR